MTMETTVRVRINGSDKEVPAGLSVLELLGWLELDPALVVVELNREILDREIREGTPVRDGDSLELVHFVGGG